MTENVSTRLPFLRSWKRMCTDLGFLDHGLIAVGLGRQGGELCALVALRPQKIAWSAKRRLCGAAGDQGNDMRL